jgi:predicted metal-dependent HD superfamily phosphohydrolase
MPLIDDALKAELTKLYAAPDRHYHNLAHIEALLALAKRLQAEIADPNAVEAAIWFHDAIYDSRAKDNEARSAALAAERLAGPVEPERLTKIVAMIEATATHQVPNLADATARHDAALLLDMDLSILGAPPADFDVYEEAVRQEYGWVPEDAWRAGRAAVLQNFLARQFIFHTAAFRSELEGQARENMARSVAALTA